MATGPGYYRDPETGPDRAVAVARDAVDRHELAAEAAGALIEHVAVEGKKPLHFLGLGVDVVLQPQ